MSTPIYDSVTEDLAEVVNLEEIRNRPAWDTKRELHEAGRKVALERAAQNAPLVVGKKKPRTA